MAQLLNVSKVSVRYELEDATVDALRNLSIELREANATLGIVGESGSGKTTLGMTLMNLIEPPAKLNAERLEVLGRDLLKMNQDELRTFRWEEIAMVFQSAMNSLNPVKNISHPIVEVLKQHKGVSSREAREIAEKLLADVGIDPKWSKSFPHELSGGMRQRVVIALALALSPKLLIADEPTSALDVVTQREILGLLKQQVVQRNLSLIFITHEISLLPNLVDYVAVMYRGEIVEHGPINKVLSEPLHPYTQMLLSTLITRQSTAAQLSSSEGGHHDYQREATAEVTGVRQQQQEQQQKQTQQEITDASCGYADRCKYAFDRCLIEKPSLRMIEEERYASCHKYN